MKKKIKRLIEKFFDLENTLKAFATASLNLIAGANRFNHRFYLL